MRFPVETDNLSLRREARSTRNEVAFLPHLREARIRVFVVDSAPVSIGEIRRNTATHPIDIIYHVSTTHTDKRHTPFPQDLPSTLAVKVDWRRVSYVSRIRVKYLEECHVDSERLDLDCATMRRQSTIARGSANICSRINFNCSIHV